MAKNDWYRDSVNPSGRTWRPDPAANPRHPNGVEATGVLVMKGGAQGSSNPGAGGRVWNDLGTELMDYRMFAHSTPRDWQQQGVMHSGRLWPTYAPPLHVLQKRGQRRPPGSPPTPLKPADREMFLEEQDRAALKRLGVAMDAAKTNQLKQQLLQQALAQAARHEDDAAAAKPPTAEEAARHLVEALAGIWKDRQLASAAAESPQEKTEEPPRTDDINAFFAESSPRGMRRKTAVQRRLPVRCRSRQKGLRMQLRGSRFSPREVT